MTHFAKSQLHTGFFADYQPETASKEQEETEALDLSFVEEYYEASPEDMEQLEEELRWQELEAALKATGETC
jgi:hypothetical protein